MKEMIPIGNNWYTAEVRLSATAIPGYSTWRCELDIASLFADENGKPYHMATLAPILEAIEDIGVTYQATTYLPEAKARHNIIQRLFLEIKNLSATPVSFADKRLVLGGFAAATGFTLPRTAIAALEATEGTPFELQDVDGATLDAAFVNITPEGAGMGDMQKTFYDVNNNHIIDLAAGGSGADLSATGGTGQVVRQNTAGGAFTVGALATADIPNDAVTYAKIQDVSATDQLLGRSTAGAGNIEEIPCTAAGRALLDDANAAAQLVTLGARGLAPRMYTVASTPTLTPEVNTYDYFEVTAQAAALNIANHATSTPGGGQMIMMSLKCDGTARALTYGSNYVAKAGVALPTTLVANKMLTLLWQWHSGLGKYNLLAAGPEA